VVFAYGHNYGNYCHFGVAAMATGAMVRLSVIQGLGGSSTGFLQLFFRRIVRRGTGSSQPATPSAPSAPMGHKPGRVILIQAVARLIESRP